MLIHPWDAAIDETEWQEWLAGQARWGVLAVNNLDSNHAPLVLPTHFAVAGEELLVHLAGANPVWPHLEVASEVRFSVHGDYAFIPGYWRAREGTPDENGVPTSYYTAVQFVCRPTIVDDARDKAAILATQLHALQPEGGHATLAAGAPPYGGLLAGMRGVRLQVLRVEAKFKYDDANPVERRARVADRLDARGRGLDARAAAQQRRRLAAVGTWRGRRERR